MTIINVFREKNVISRTLSVLYSRLNKRKKEKLKEKRKKYLCVDKKKENRDRIKSTTILADMKKQRKKGKSKKNYDVTYYVLSIN